MKPPESLLSLGNEKFNIPAILRRLEANYDDAYGGSERNEIGLVIRLIRALVTAVEDDYQQAYLDGYKAAGLIRNPSVIIYDEIKNPQMGEREKGALLGSLLTLCVMGLIGMTPQCTCSPTELDDPKCPVHSVPNWQRGTISDGLVHPPVYWCDLCRKPVQNVPTDSELAQAYSQGYQDGRRSIATKNSEPTEQMLYRGYKAGRGYTPVSEIRDIWRAMWDELIVWSEMRAKVAQEQPQPATKGE